MTNKKTPNNDSVRVRMTKAKRKQAALLAYEKTMGNISATCKEVGISRETFYRWMREDKKFETKVSEIGEANIDFAETVLLKNIREGKETSLIFYLKTKGRERGYIEKIEQDITVNPFLELMQEATSEEDGE
jgi:transposase-like protein